MPMRHYKEERAGAGGRGEGGYRPQDMRATEVKGIMEKALNSPQAVDVELGTYLPQPSTPGKLS